MFVTETQRQVRERVKVGVLGFLSFFAAVLLAFLIHHAYSSAAKSSTGLQDEQTNGKSEIDP